MEEEATHATELSNEGQRDDIHTYIGSIVRGCFYFSTFGKHTAEWVYDGNTIKQFICGETEEIRRVIHSNFDIVGIFPVSGNYAVKCRNGEDFTWFVYNCGTKKRTHRFNAHRDHTQYAIQDCLVLNNSYIDMVTMKRHALNTKHIVTYYNSADRYLITYKMMPIQFAPFCQFYINGEQQDAILWFHGDGSTSTYMTGNCIYKFHSYKGGSGEHLPHFTTGYMLASLTVVGDLILAGTSRDFILIDNPKCTNHTLRLVWSKPNYKLYQICRINVGKQTKCAQHTAEAVSETAAETAAEAADSTAETAAETVAEAANSATETANSATEAAAETETANSAAPETVTEAAKTATEAAEAVPETANSAVELDTA